MRVVLIVNGVADADRIFKAFSEGGKVDMPLDKTFFAAKFGMLTDRFNIPWMIITEERP
jgi:PhnB protein